ncbi:hypothetical protein FRX31_007894, partial [Thalictrum thalictroides]
MKATWNLLTSNTLWAVFMRAKYIQNRSLTSIKLVTSTSRTWKDCWHCLEDIIEHSTWEFGPGNFSLTHENWMGIESLANKVPINCPQYSLNFAASRDFNLPLFSTQQQEYLRSQYRQLKENLQEDKRIWPHSQDGKFSIKSYIKLTQAHNPSYAILKRIWASFVPTKYSMFVWRLFYDVIPVDSVIIKCKIPMASKCLCCTNTSQESTIHLFIKGTLATYVWSHFNLMFDICPGGTISQTLELWFQRGRKGSMEQFICTLTPLMILWEVWRERCSRKYEEKHQWQSCSIIFKIRFWIIRLCDRFTPRRKSSE